MGTASFEGKLEEQALLWRPVLKGSWRIKSVVKASFEGKLEGITALFCQF